jgi:hypothetical protein
LGRRIATYILAALGGLAGAVLFWLSTGFIADFVLGLAGMSPREGGRAMFAFFAIAPFGALLGFGLGIWMVLRARGGPTTFTAFAGAVLFSGLAIAALYGAVFGYLYLTDDVLVHNGPPPQAKFELRLPANAMLPEKLTGVTVDLNTDKNVMPANLVEPRTEDGRPVIAGDVDLYFRTSSRLLVLRLPGEPDRLFVLKLPGNPPASAEFGPWQRVDYIDDAPPNSPRKGGPGDDYEIRYRVERAG